ncbi:MAG: glycosyltransferase [Candidatus Peregrinibacteria bacterium]
MKLLMISGDRSVSQGKRGAFWYTLQEFSKHWERIDVVCPLSPGSSPIGGGELRLANVFFHPSPHTFWYQPLWVFRKGRELIAEHRHDVMTVHEYPPFYNGVGAAFLAWATKIPFVIEIHHVVGQPRAASCAEWVGCILSRLYVPVIARFASAVRVVNAGVKHLLERWGVPSGKCHIVPSFYLDREFFRTLRPQPVSYDIAFSGRLVPNKGLPDLLRAIAGIPDCRMVVIGDGTMKGAYEKLAATLDIHRRVTFLGWLSMKETVMEAIMSAKILVMNSLSEGGPRVVLEAMAAGLPVIATPVGIVPEVIRDGVNGVLTDGSVADLQKKITVLLGDELARKRMGEEAKKVLDRFERVKLIKAYADFLKSFVPSPES